MSTVGIKGLMSFCLAVTVWNSFALIHAAGGHIAVAYYGAIRVQQ